MLAALAAAVVVLKAMDGRGGWHLDTLVADTGLDASTVSGSLMVLELSGKLVQEPWGFYTPKTARPKRLVHRDGSGEHAPMRRWTGGCGPRPKPRCWFVQESLLLAAVLALPACGPSLPNETGPPNSATVAASAAPPSRTSAPSAAGGTVATPQPHASTDERSGADAQRAELPVPLADVLAREPLRDSRCRLPFPSFWTWDARAAGADANALRQRIWLAPNEASAPPVVAPEQPRAARARCIAVGPHRGLNLANWCCRAAVTARTVPPPAGATDLVATLAVEQSLVTADAALVVAVAIENRASTPRELDSTVATAAVLLLEVRDAAGKPVPTIPPPTPPAHRAILQLAPHGARTFQHRMGVFSPPLPAGSYTVRVRGRDITSGTLEFRIAPQRRAGP